MDLFDLAAKITLDASEYERGVDEASGKLSEFGEKIKTSFKVAAGAAAAVTAAVGGVSAAFIKGTSEIAAYGDNIDKMSQKMGLSTDAYQEWDAILQHSGTNIEGMQRGMMSLATAVENGSDAFQQLGISQEQVASMSQEELFSSVIAGLQGMEEGSERAVLAQKLLGGAAKELGPLLNTSAEDTEAMRQRVHELGGVMSEDAVKASAKFQDSLQDMKTVFSGLKANITTQFLPSMSTVMDGVSKLFSGDSAGGIAMITEGIRGFSDQIQEVVPELIAIATEVLEPVIAAVADVLPDLIVTLLPVLIEGTVKIVSALVEKLPDILGAIWEALKAIGADLWPTLEGAFSGLGEWFSQKFGEAWTAITDVFSGVGPWFQEKFNDAWDKITGVFDGWGEFFSGLWDDISTTFSELGAKIGDAIGGAVKSGINSVLEWVEGTVNDAIDIINSVIKFINNIPGVDLGPLDKVTFARLAIGKDYVPYDNYPAYLHKGEAVLTAREADEWRRGEGGGGKTVNLNIYAQQLSQADMDYIVATVNRELA